MQMRFLILKSIFTGANLVSSVRDHKQNFENAVLRFKKLPEKPVKPTKPKTIPKMRKYAAEIRAYNQAVEQKQIYTTLDSFLKHLRDWQTKVSPSYGYPWKEKLMTVEELNQAFTYENFKDWVCAKHPAPYKKVAEGIYEFNGKENPEKLVQNFIFNKIGSLSYSVYMHTRSTSQGESKRDSKVMLRM